jgi:D-sedoheptulose 7-phosphate isomerase
MAVTWQEHVEALARLLRALSARDRNGVESPVQEAFDRWCEWTLELRARRRAIYLVGNGASASMASHFAADLAKNGHLHTEVFSDLSLITALSNDIGYESVFAEPLARRAEAGDHLVAISSSGRSPNVLAAVRVARERGLRVITLSAMRPDNPLRGSGDLNFYVPADQYGFAESAHAVVLHNFMDMVQAQTPAEESR